MAGTQEDDHRERRRQRRKLRQNNTVVTVGLLSGDSKKARICIRCGNWIRKVQLIYEGKNWGSDWIHIRARGMGERKYLWTIERCRAEPRPVPIRE